MITSRNSIVWCCRLVRHACCLIAIVLSVVTHCAAADDDTEAQVRKLANPYVEHEQVVGLSVGVIKDGKSVTVHLGRMRADGPTPDDDTIYELGSVSKVFTGILAADSIVQGKMRLDQPAQELLPATVTMPGDQAHPVTVKHLLTHQSGLPPIADNMPNVNSQNPYVGYTSELMYEFLSGHKLQRKAGSKAEYSNLGMSLAGHLVCRSAGLDYDQLLKQRLTGPLKMSSTGVTLGDDVKDQVATPYIGVGTPGVLWDFEDLPGAGGVRSTTADMLRFAAAHIEPADDAAGQAIELAWKKHQTGGGDAHAMGLAWQIAGDRMTRWHNGQTLGSHSILLINRQIKCAVVVLSNTASMELDRLGQDVMQLLAGAHVEPRTFSKYITVADDVMQKYVGRYELTPQLVFTVSVKTGKLMVGLTGQPELPIYAKSETKWEYKAVPASIEFQLDDDGKCQSLELTQNGATHSAKKME